MKKGLLGLGGCLNALQCLLEAPSKPDRESNGLVKTNMWKSDNTRNFCRSVVPERSGLEPLTCACKWSREEDGMLGEREMRVVGTSWMGKYSMPNPASARWSGCRHW